LVDSASSPITGNRAGLLHWMDYVSRVRRSFIPQFFSIRARGVCCARRRRAGVLEAGIPFRSVSVRRRPEVWVFRGSISRPIVPAAAFRPPSWKFTRLSAISGRREAEIDHSSKFRWDNPFPQTGRDLHRKPRLEIGRETCQSRYGSVSDGSVSSKMIHYSG
jgi:hypothetical protein